MHEVGGQSSWGRFGLHPLGHTSNLCVCVFSSRLASHTLSLSLHRPRPLPGELQLTTSGGAEVLAGHRLVLSTDLLLAQDQSGQPERLRYRLTEAPLHGLLHGAGQPGVPLTTWSQLDLAAQRLCYTHDNSRHTHSDSFRFIHTNTLTHKHTQLLLTDYSMFL